MTLTRMVFLLCRRVRATPGGGGFRRLLPGVVFPEKIRLRQNRLSLGRRQAIQQAHFAGIADEHTLGVRKTAPAVQFQFSQLAVDIYVEFHSNQVEHRNQLVQRRKGPARPELENQGTGADTRFFDQILRGQVLGMRLLSKHFSQRFVHPATSSEIRLRATSTWATPSVKRLSHKDTILSDSVIYHIITLKTIMAS